LTPELASKIETHLTNLQKSQLPASAKLTLLRDTIERNFAKDHFLAREVREFTGKAPPGQTPSQSPTGGDGDTETGVTQLIEEALLLLPLQVEEPPAPAATDLPQQIDTLVRVALNEKFSSSLLFRTSALLLVVAASMFSFGLFRLYDKVSRADEVVQQFDKQLAASGILISTKEAALNERLAKAQTTLENEVESARKVAVNAQRDAMASLNTTLQGKIDQVERAKVDANGRIEKVLADVERSKNDATKGIEDRVKDAGAAGSKALERERENQQGLLVKRAGEIIADLKEPSIRNVLGRAFWVAVGSLALSVASIVVALVAWWRS